MSEHHVKAVVNGQTVRARVEARLTLCDFLRVDVGYTGVHIGCEHGVCGACTVLLDGRPARACLTLAIQADGREIETVESLADGAELHPLQRAFAELGAAQCGYCTPGILLTAQALLATTPVPTREGIKEALAGNLCRCTGYMKIFESVVRAYQK